MFLLQMSGVPGSGKSTVAAHVVKTHGAVAVDYDVVKTGVLNAGFSVADSSTAAYEVMYGLARHLLVQGHNVVLDSPCVWPRIVTEGLEIAREHGAAYKHIECQIHDLQILEDRLSRRPRLRSHRRTLSLPPPDLGDTPVDGEHLFRTWMSQAQHPPTNYLQLNTHHPLPALQPEIDAYLKQ